MELRLSNLGTILKRVQEPLGNTLCSLLNNKKRHLKSIFRAKSFKCDFHKMDISALKPLDQITAETVLSIYGATGALISDSSQMSQGLSLYSALST